MYELYIYNIIDMHRSLCYKITSHRSYDSCYNFITNILVYDLFNKSAVYPLYIPLILLLICQTA